MWWHWLEFLHRWSVDHHKNTVSWSVCFWMAMLYDASQQPSYRQQFVSLGDYVAVDGTELSLKEGEVLEILRVGNNGWWYAHSLTTETEGWVPSTYLDPVPTQHLSTHSSSGNDKVWLSLVLAVATSPWPAQQYSVTWLSMLYLKLVKTSCKSLCFLEMCDAVFEAILQLPPFLSAFIHCCSLYLLILWIYLLYLLFALHTCTQAYVRESVRESK